MTWNCVLHLSKKLDQIYLYKILHYYVIYLNNKDRDSNSDVVYRVLHNEIVESIITALWINSYYTCKSIKTLWFTVVVKKFIQLI